MIIKIFRFLVGFVRFRAVGGFTERFINECKKDNIPLWNIENRQGEIFANTNAGGYKQMRSAAKRTGMRLKIIKKRGLRFFINKNRMRSGLCIGGVACLLILITLSQFVWRIEVVGNVETQEDEILSVFEEQGVKIGAKTSDLNLKEITETALHSLDALSWASVNKKGSVLCIEVREKKKIPEMYDSSTPTNVVASDDGVILSSDILQGTEEIKVGSAVRKGDLLISGVVIHKDGTQELIHADGFVRAEIKDNFTVSQSELSILPLKKHQRCTELFFFGFVIPVGLQPDGGIVSKNSSFLKSGDAYLPVGVIKTSGLDFSDEETLSEEMSELICKFKCSEHIKNLLDGAEVKKTEIKRTQTADSFAFGVYSICEKDISELREIYIEKADDSE